MYLESADVGPVNIGTTGFVAIRAIFPWRTSITIISYRSLISKSIAAVYVPEEGIALWLGTSVDDRADCYAGSELTAIVHLWMCCQRPGHLWEASVVGACGMVWSLQSEVRWARRGYHWALSSARQVQTECVFGSYHNCPWPPRASDRSQRTNNPAIV